jgi:hypothetical protein
MEKERKRSFGFLNIKNPKWSQKNKTAYGLMPFFEEALWSEERRKLSRYFDCICPTDRIGEYFPDSTLILEISSPE